MQQQLILQKSLWFYKSYYLY
ncbi:hypothetical protein RDI58_029488 [Solanum bulbocastanum]|uniref:Uncharacterized protein n=1 Tax=Solanum bulbocastanum TaxID=147425 RepID=A0AAN8XZZ8_SOLBU